MVRRGSGEGRSGDSATGGTLAAALRRLALLTLDDATLDGVLDLVVQAATGTIAGAAAASATIAAGDGPPRTAASRAVRAVDSVQDGTRAGPRPLVLEQGRRYHGALERDRTRWPQFCRAALDAGYATVLALPLGDRSRTFGALILYSPERPGFEDADRAAAEALALQAGVTLANLQALTAARLTAEHLRQGLATRELIGQAQGILMARHMCGSESAFAILRHRSQATNRKVRDIAADVVADYERDPSEAPAPGP